MKAAGLIFDNSLTYLDHLAPFCALLGWPLILCDPDLQEQAKRFYPDLLTIKADPLGLNRWIEARYTHLVTCTPRALLNASLGIHSLRTFWLPHGNSDKGQISPFYEVLCQEETVFVYGQKMVDLLSRLDILQKIPHVVRIGNFRWTYYQKMLPFYETFSLEFGFERIQPTILYAPTWEDQENNCSLWNALPILSEHLPQQFNLLVKPHPNTLLQKGPQIERLIGKTERSNLKFLLENLPIFPLLAKTDFYLGDRSSIGYDYLFLNKPLFFLDPHNLPKGRDLLSCGQSTSPEDFFRLLSEKDLYSESRKNMAFYAFDSCFEEDFRMRIRALLSL